MASKDEKPGHILEIPESLGRDIDKGMTPPVEAFMSDSALQEIHDAQTAQPIHAESLRPITQAEAARRTTFDGETMPKLPVPRRVIPAPFQRRRVTGGKHGKTWQLVKAQAIRAGDIITGIGLVEHVEEIILRDDEHHAVGLAVRVTGAGGNTATYASFAEVSVFRKGELWARSRLRVILRAPTPGGASSRRPAGRWAATSACTAWGATSTARPSRWKLLITAR